MHTLQEARDWLRARVDKGERCPCCNQFAKVYKRQVTSTSAAALVTMWSRHGFDVVHLPTLTRMGGDTCKMVYWGLIEEESTRRTDGGRAGWWAVTPKGRDWILGKITIPKYARVYDGRCLGLTGNPVTIQQALGKRFDLQELMAA